MGLDISQEKELLALLEYEERMKIPPKMLPLYEHFTYKFCYGGRGGTKSWTYGKLFIDLLTREKHRLLCVREIQDSLKDSVYSLLCDMIYRLGVSGWTIKADELIHENGSKIIFRGLKDIRAAGNIKSYEGYDLCWVEEGQSVSRESWIVLTPTILRNAGAEIWCSFNRYSEFDAVWELYCINPRKNSLIININWRDNPWISQELLDEMEFDRENDYDLYMHKWEGYPIAQIEKAIIDRHLVNEAVKRIVQPNGKQVLGVDVARFGNDKTKVYERRGDKVIKLFERKHEMPIITAREVAARADNRFTLINVDNGGLGGGGLIDQLKLLGFQNVVEINFGGTPKNKKEYVNIATEMYFECKERLKTAQLPDILELKQDLEGRLFGYDKKYKKVIESKENFKERYKRSPDDGDACLLCFYDPGIYLKTDESIKKQMQERTINRNRKRLIV